MTEYAKLLAARMQIENIVQLTADNHYKDYLYRHLVLIHVELERQLANMAEEQKSMLTPEERGLKITE